MNKVLKSAAEAVALIPDGATVMCGGFGLCGLPENLIKALHDRGTRDLTIISNNPGVDDFGVGMLVRNKQVRKIFASYVGENKEFERQAIAGEIEYTLVPQGTLAERIRAAGAGIGGAEGKETRVIDGRNYILELPLHADFALVKPYKADTKGNLIYRKTARNFNPVMATAATITLAEVEDIVEPGGLDPDAIVTSGIYVTHILKGAYYEKRIERRTVRQLQAV